MSSGVFGCTDMQADAGEDALLLGVSVPLCVSVSVWGMLVGVSVSVGESSVSASMTGFLVFCVSATFLEGGGWLGRINSSLE